MASALEIATRVRNLISEKSPAATAVTIPHIQALIPTAVEAWGREAMNDPEKLDHLVTQFTAVMTAGAFDLTNHLNGTTAKISLNQLRANTVYTYVSGEKVPMTWVSSYSQLKFGRYPNHVPAVFLDDNILRTRNTDGSLTSLGTANITFESVNLPVVASDIPAALLGDFILFLAELAVREKFVDGR